MVIRILIVLIVAGLTCSPKVNDQTEETTSTDKVILYSKGASKQIAHRNLKHQIIEEAKHLFASADNIYLKPISTSLIKTFKDNYCLEIIFESQQKITVQAINETRTISKILIPLDKSWCADSAHIIYGDPDYKTFNMLLNSKGCKKLQEIINKKNSE